MEITNMDSNAISWIVGAAAPLVAAIASFVGWYVKDLHTRMDDLEGAHVSIKLDMVSNYTPRVSFDKLLDKLDNRFDAFENKLDKIDNKLDNKVDK